MGQERRLRTREHFRSASRQSALGNTPKEVCRSPFHQTAASPLQQPRAQPRFFSPEGANPQKCLKGKIQAAADHSEIIPGAVNDAKTQVVSPTDVTGEPNFETGPELGEHFGLASEMVGLRIDEEGVRRPLRVKLISFAAAENRAHAAPGVRR